MNKITIFILLSPIFSLISGVELVNDNTYKEKAQLEFIEANNDPNKLFAVAGSFMDARNYAKAEEIYQGLIQKYKINDPMVYSNLSVFQGKQGKYKQAIESANLALETDPNNMHAKAVKASWLYESGDKDAGINLFESIPVPEAGSEMLSLYNSCGACFYASTGNVDKVKFFINKIVTENDLEALKFIKRDIVFDRYRDSEWFKLIFGQTLQ